MTKFEINLAEYRPAFVFVNIEKHGQYLFIFHDPVSLVPEGTEIASLTAPPRLPYVGHKILLCINFDILVLFTICQKQSGGCLQEKWMNSLVVIARARNTPANPDKADQQINLGTKR